VSRAVNSEDRRRAIALAVYRVVARDGVEATSMRTIAAEAGCTTGSLTHHFTDRRALLEFTVGMAVEESMARLVATSRRDGLRAALTEFLPLDELRRQENAVWLVGIGAAARDPELARSLSRRYAAADELLAAELRRRLQEAGREVADDEVEMLVEEVLTAVDGIAVYAQADPDRYPPERQLALVDRVLARTGLA
jgi:AcrR family transcriptional regulator